MSEKLTIEALRRDPAYLALTEKQRVLVETFLETGDKVQAVQAAYNCKSKESARIMSYSVFSNLRVLAALAAANGDSDLESFKRDVLNAARNRKLTVAQFSALKLYAQLCGFVAGSSLPDEIDCGEIAEPPKTAAAPTPEPLNGRVPVGCRPVRHRETGRLLGYITPDGERVALNIVEVAR